MALEREKILTPPAGLLYASLMSHPPVVTTADCPRNIRYYRFSDGSLFSVEQTFVDTYQLRDNDDGCIAFVGPEARERALAHAKDIIADLVEGGCAVVEIVDQLRPTAEVAAAKGGYYRAARDYTCVGQTGHSAGRCYVVASRLFARFDRQPMADKDMVALRDLSRGQRCTVRRVDEYTAEMVEEIDSSD